MTSRAMICDIAVYTTSVAWEDFEVRSPVSLLVPILRDANLFKNDSSLVVPVVLGGASKLRLTSTLTTISG